MNRQTGIPQGSHAEWEKKQRLQLKLVRWSITLLCVAVAVVGLLLLILPGMKIKEDRGEREHGDEDFGYHSGSWHSQGR